MNFNQTKRYLDKFDLTAALWWFIENCNEDDPIRSSVFFYLRERVRSRHNTEQPK